eukprot:CAMPEP_0176127208 /NCGR_PEP_ID=MMETSP0120_2-20121206/64236_1 /TAXON_ID=160619 /ORGANISM="Kryptoperidinium foliaceum, Strain CCMP 1326" /LENGTH=109 /DNA_ID=CAMNT_0017462205 /DNA_START=274 /DNA_END=600 /DNA_ORIENTATION=+
MSDDEMKRLVQDWRRSGGNWDIQTLRRQVFKLAKRTAQPPEDLIAMYLERDERRHFIDQRLFEFKSGREAIASLSKVIHITQCESRTIEVSYRPNYFWSISFPEHSQGH